jgi:hypothetical protein
MALRRRQPVDVVHHSDQGVQYTSLAFSRRLREAGVAPSMGSRGDAYDNALAESFWSTLDRELLYGKVFLTRAAARMALFDYIEGWFNSHRRHSSLACFRRPNSSAAGALNWPKRELRSPSPRVSTKAGQAQTRDRLRLGGLPERRIGPTEFLIGGRSVRPRPASKRSRTWSPGGRSDCDVADPGTRSLSRRRMPLLPRSRLSQNAVEPMAWWRCEGRRRPGHRRDHRSPRSSPDRDCGVAYGHFESMPSPAERVCPLGLLWATPNRNIGQIPPHSQTPEQIKEPLLA